MGLEPVPGCHTPTISRGEPGKHVLGHRSGQIVPDASLVLEEVSGYDGTNGVEPDVFRTRCASPAPIEACKRINTALLEGLAKNVEISQSAAADEDVPTALVVHRPGRRCSRCFGIGGVHALEPCTLGADFPVLRQVLE